MIESHILGGEEIMHGDPLAPVLLILLIMLAAVKLGSEISERLGRPAVLGELIVGFVLGDLILLNQD